MHQAKIECLKRQKILGKELNVLVEDIVKKAIDIAKSELSQFSLKLEKKIANEYKIDEFLAAKLCTHVFYYLTENKIKTDPSSLINKGLIAREALIQWTGYEWKLSERIEDLTDEKIKAITDEIINEHGEYYAAVVEKFLE